MADMLLQNLCCAHRGLSVAGAIVGVYRRNISLCSVIKQFHLEV